MGIKNLHTFLRKTCPQIYEEVHLSEYGGKRIAVDTAIYLCKFKTSWGGQWMTGFLQLCSVMRHYSIHPVFVFDSSFPPEKDEEKKRRSDARRQQRQRIDELKTQWEAHKKNLITRPDEKSYCILNDPSIPINLYSFLFKTFISTDSKQEDTPHQVSVTDVDYEFHRIENTLLVIYPEDYDLIRSMLDVLRIPWVMAIGEAEATASYMCQNGIVDAVLTDDTDVLAYACPVFLHRLNMQDHTCMRIHFDQVLSALDMSPDMFVDFCILCGTDYNQNLPGIGNEKAYRFLQQYKTIEQILENVPRSMTTTTVFPYKRVREMFVERPIMGDSFTNIPLCDFPDWSRLTSFVFYHNCHPIDLSEIHHYLYSNVSLVFPSSADNNNNNHGHKNNENPATTDHGRSVSLLRPQIQKKNNFVI